MVTLKDFCANNTIKEQNTLIPIICRQIASGYIIWTDEYQSYQNLRLFNFSLDTVCQKYEFINKNTGTNTQAIESFPNELKKENKLRKGVATDKRGVFLKEFCFYFNNRSNYFSSILESIKI
ncbi:hypothetical protein H311_01236 [Anncaliia algerae PRA109]|nr:hypothetical protein H311_01236 [Anncaliia algerae PRA109]